METDNENKDKLEIKKYFQCSEDNDIFDQISKCNQGSKQVTEERKEEVAENAASCNVNFSKISNNTTIEPVICRVFAANDDDLTETNARKMQQETFFDLLGTNTRYSTTTTFEDCNYPINKCSHILATLSPEFPSEGT